MTLDGQRLAILRLTLPPILSEFAEIIGVEATLALAKAYGGGELYVPKRIKDSHKIALLIGAEKAGDLAQHMGGLRFKDFANASIALRAVEREIMMMRLEAGDISIQAAARELGIHTRRLRHLINQRKPKVEVPKAVQLTLF